MTDAARLAALGTSCPDHFLRTKIRPLFIDWNPSTEDVATLQERLDAGLQSYVADYELLRGVSTRRQSGDPAAGADGGPGARRRRMSPSAPAVGEPHDRRVLSVCDRGHASAESIGGYKAAQEAFDIEYWRLEEAKLQRMPKARPFAGRVVLVAGAGSHRAGVRDHDRRRRCFRGLSRSRRQRQADETAKVIEAKRGSGIGVAGSGVSGCGPAIGLTPTPRTVRSARPWRMRSSPTAASTTSA